MTRLLACLGTTLCLLAGGTLGPTAPTAIAVPAAGVSQPAGSMPVPGGPAEAWVLADMDTGEILAGRNEHAVYAPASTIKVLLAMTVVVVMFIIVLFRLAISMVSTSVLAMFWRKYIL